jgi:carbamate kinase
VLTHVVVAADDPGFDRPTKPVGPFYDEPRARELEHERGWALVHDAGRGYRRVVPSPEPLEVVEVDAIRTLVDHGVVAIACGGGGIPVVRRGEHLHGIDAVIDKDRASALLAAELGASRLVILTAVPAVYRGFGTEQQEEVRELTVEQAQELAAEVAAGSMRPKLEAAAQFVFDTDGDALITDAESLERALAGQAGTRVAG